LSSAMADGVLALARLPIGDEPAVPQPKTPKAAHGPPEGPTPSAHEKAPSTNWQWWTGPAPSVTPKGAARPGWGPADGLAAIPSQLHFCNDDYEPT
jgi:hypothetical protein